MDQLTEQVKLMAEFDTSLEEENFPVIAPGPSGDLGEGLVAFVESNVVKSAGPLTPEIFADAVSIAEYPAMPGPNSMDNVAYDPFEPQEVEPADGTKAPKSKTFKADKMINGFLLTADPLLEDADPFWMEAHILGKNEFYVSGGQEGKLNVSEIKQLRQNLKHLMNQEDASFTPQGDIYEGGKTTLKIDAPWLPTAEQAELAEKLIHKAIKDTFVEEAPEEDVNELTAAMLGVFTKLFAQMSHAPVLPTTETDTNE